MKVHSFLCTNTPMFSKITNNQVYTGVIVVYLLHNSENKQLSSYLEKCTKSLMKKFVTENSNAALCLQNALRRLVYLEI